MEDITLSRLVDQLKENRIDDVGRSLRFIPLGGGGKGYAKAFLEFFQPVPGKTITIPEDGNHCHGAGIIVPAGFIVWGVCREHHPA